MGLVQKVASHWMKRSGKLVTLFHGTSVRDIKFDLDHMGGGKDQFGPGIYMVDKVEVARTYGRYVYQCVVDTSKFVPNRSKPNRAWIVKFIEKHFDKVGWENWADSKPAAKRELTNAVLREESFSDALQSLWREVFNLENKPACVEFSRSGIMGTQNYTDNIVVYTVYDLSVVKTQEMIETE